LPLLHRARQFLQHLWKQAYDWDDQLSDELQNEWKTIVDAIDGFRKQIPRFVLPKHSYAHLVICADASTEAYAACAYLAAPPQTAHLVMAKAKLPPLKSQITVPKLELSALRLAARLAVSVVNELTAVTTIDQVLILSDSEIALGWTTAPNYLQATLFVRNRVVEIRKVINHLQSQHCRVQFGHISTQENLADLATRGIDKIGFIDHPWWQGPAFLLQPKEKWTTAYRSIPIQEAPGEDGRCDTVPKQVALVAPNSETSPQPTTAYSDIFSNIKTSDLASIRRIVAYTLRFIHNTVVSLNKRRPSRIRLSLLFDDTISTTSRFPSGLEIRRANTVLVKQHQLARVTTSTRQALRHLNLYEDHHGLLRCRGRLGKSTLDDDAKYPILILQKTWLSRLIIEDCHRSMHTSISHTMSRGDDDPDYELPGAQPQSLTKQQLVEAVNSSTTNVNRFWHQWQHEYLTSLREHHVRQAIRARGSRIPPTVGQIVLISDAGQPRHSWRMGRIKELRQDSEGNTREAVVTLPSKRDIRRPVNLLVPLELDGVQTSTTDPIGNDQPSGDTPRSLQHEPASQQKPYNLRKKDRVDYARLAGQTNTMANGGDYQHMQL
uniref:DUF5641 domain-containing protein n=1 Tax=Nippostrongylus brasiliensis TaxID=27835 RepID=A0A0N4XF64_NIPBR